MQTASLYVEGTDTLSKSNIVTKLEWLMGLTQLASSVALFEAGVHQIWKMF